MPKWTTHTEGGSWTGGGTEVRDCSDSRQSAILSAFSEFMKKPCIDCFPGLRSCLEDKWDDVEIDCTDSDCDGTLDGRQSGNKILLCCNTISCGSSSSRLGPVLLHELVHVCGGTELDSEAVEHACFDGDGATLPFGDDWDKFRSETSKLDGNEIERVGKYVIWNSDTGEVWGKNVSGGGWAGGGDVSKGSRCFQDSGWIHDYSGGGGWI